VPLEQARVCMVLHQDYYRDSRVRRYAEALARTGAQVDVLCLRDTRQLAHPQTPGIRVYAIPLSRGYRTLANYFLEYGKAFVLFSIWLLGLHLRNALLPKILGAKLILDIHDPMPEFYMSKYERQPDSLLVKLLRFQERISSRFAHALITANPNFRRNLIQRGIPAGKITVVNNVADPEIFDRGKYRGGQGKRNGGFTLIYPGTIAPRYGLAVAIRALPRLVGEIPGLALVIMGTRTQHVDELSALAEQLGVASHVCFKPAMPVEQVPEELVQADVGVYLALPDAHMSIAMPSKVLEYVAMGLPIIASRLKVLEDSFADAAIRFFEPGNVDEFARGVLELYRDPTRRETLVNAADRVYLQAHAWTSERDRYFTLLHRLLTSRARTFALRKGDGGSPEEIQ